MFFIANREHKIGFKKLSAADLGLGSSHQTHIGLYEGVLDFLPSKAAFKQAMLIADDYCDIVDCYFDRIENPDGSFRSPKIRIGSGTSSPSVVSQIRRFAHERPNLDWFLVWFGLESEELVFILFNSASKDYASLMQLFPKGSGIIDDSHPSFSTILQFVENKVNDTSFNIQQDLEIVAQLGDNPRNYKPFDIHKAEAAMKAAGQKGEQLIAEYLDRLKSEGTVDDYKWMNQSRESALPFDFVVKQNGTETHVDVKSTNYTFDQKMVFSSQEMNFISENSNYSVFRVYDLAKEAKKLKVCKDCLEFAKGIVEVQRKFAVYTMAYEAEVSSVKYAVRPTSTQFKVGPEILLTNA